MADAGEETRIEPGIGRQAAGPEPGRAAAAARKAREIFDTLREMAEAFRWRRRVRADVAKITESNPDLVMKVAPDGRILYANQSVERTLYEIGIPMQHAELLLPDGAEEIVRTVLGTRGRKIELLWVTEGRSIRYTVFGLGNEDAVVFQGVDVSGESGVRDGA